MSKFILLFLFLNSLLFAVEISPIDRQAYCNYRIDYFGNIFSKDGKEFETISEEKKKTIKNDCWDPVYKKKYFFEASLKYKYNTTHYLVDDKTYSSQRTPINFDFNLNAYRKHQNKILLNLGLSTFYSFPLPDLDHTNNITDFYGVNMHFGVIKPFSFGELRGNIGWAHFIVATSLSATKYNYLKKFSPYLEIEYQKRYQEFIGIIGASRFLTQNSSGSETSAWLKLRYEPPTNKIQVTLTPYYRYTIQYHEIVKGITQYFGLELGYRF